MQMRFPQQRWEDWYAWFPVFQLDDGLVWLEWVWRRQAENGLWEYRSLRSELQREIEAARREI